MTYDELNEYLDTNGLGIEVQPGPQDRPRDRRFSLTRPAGMTRGELVDHAATIGKWLQEYRFLLLADFGNRISTVSGITTNDGKADWRAVRAATIRSVLLFAKGFGRRVAWFSVYDRVVSYSLKGGLVPLHATHITAVCPTSLAICSSDYVWRYLPHSRPPNGWKWLKGFVPPPHWNRPACMIDPHEEEEVRSARKRRAKQWNDRWESMVRSPHEGKGYTQELD